MPDKQTTDADAILVDYVLRYGGRCRECADAKVWGVCDHSGIPCHLDSASKAVRHMLSAIRYGVKHGFIDNPIAATSPSPAEATEEIAKRAFLAGWGRFNTTEPFEEPRASDEFNRWWGAKDSAALAATGGRDE